MNAVKVLLDIYQIEDPVSVDIIGEFQNAELAELFDHLLIKGNESQTEALKVGAAIEEIDIIDLLKIINDDEVNSDVAAVYSNLKKGSENHLKAFVRNLNAAGIEYEPQYLDEDYYNEIINR